MGWISQAQMQAARAEPLGTIARQGSQFASQGGYFVEEVRRRLIDRFGENAESGPYSVYAGGLWVRSSFNPDYQKWATEALRDGMMRYSAGRGWKDVIGSIDLDDGDWARQLASTGKNTDYKDWRIGVYLGDNEIGFSDGSRAPVAGCARCHDAGHADGRCAFWQELGGAQRAGSGAAAWWWSIPHPVAIFAMQGGFDNRLSSFNRATQAMRQPGSTIKPFVYASAIDQGMTPATMIVDGTSAAFIKAPRLGRNASATLAVPVDRAHIRCAGGWNSHAIS